MEWIIAVLDFLLDRFGVRRRDPDKGFSELRIAKQRVRDARRTGDPDEMEYIYDDARMAVRQSIRSGLPDLKEWFEAGSLAEDLEEFEYAARAYRVVARKSRSNLSAEACCRLAELCAQQGQIADAKKWLRKVFKFYPDHVEAKTLKQQLALYTTEELITPLNENTAGQQNQVNRND